MSAEKFIAAWCIGYVAGWLLFGAALLVRCLYREIKRQHDDYHRRKPPSGRYDGSLLVELYEKTKSEAVQ